MKIVFNGQEYASVDEMPAEARAVYQEAIQSLSGSSPDGASHVNVRTKTKFVVNGKEYASLDDLPKDVRSLYDFATHGGGSRVKLFAGIDADSSRQAAWLVTGMLLGAVMVLGLLLWVTH